MRLTHQYVRLNITGDLAAMNETRIRKPSQPGRCCPYVEPAANLHPGHHGQQCNTIKHSEPNQDTVYVALGIQRTKNSRKNHYFVRQPRIGCSEHGNQKDKRSVQHPIPSRVLSPEVTDCPDTGKRSGYELCPRGSPSDRQAEHSTHCWYELALGLRC